MQLNIDRPSARIEYICPECKEGFVTSYSHQKYCKKACKDARDKRARESSRKHEAKLKADKKTQSQNTKLNREWLTKPLGGDGERQEEV